MNEQDILDKLEKLLRLSESSEQNEAELAMKRAMDLATKYNIDLNRVSMASGKSASLEFITERTVIGQRMPIAQFFIVGILLQHFNVRILYGGNRAFGRNLVFIGTANNIAIAKKVNDYLNHVFPVLWRKYRAEKNLPLNMVQWREGKQIKISFRESYFKGLASGFSSKLSEQEQQTINSNLSESEKQKYGLVVVDHKEQLSNFMKMEWPKLVSVNKQSTGLAWETYQQGVVDGKELNVVEGYIN